HVECDPEPHFDDLERKRVSGWAAVRFSRLQVHLRHHQPDLRLCLRRLHAAPVACAQKGEGCGIETKL
ncbi:hypothetical protein AK812_SmicGene45766, partial [Symbiodinium microadriaticum]